MDKLNELEVVRQKLKDLPRSKVLLIADAAQISPSTLQKFRAGIIREPGFGKVTALLAAMRKLRGVLAETKTTEAG